MEQLFTEAPGRSSDAATRPLDRSARAAITALAQALDVFDPAAARRAALRAHLVDRIAVAAGALVQDRVDAITGSLLAEIGILLTHVRPVGTVDIVPDPSSAVLASNMLKSLPGLGSCANAVRHQHERWDGSGGPHALRGPEIPLSARLLALAATLVGHPASGSAPNWTARRRRVDELLGSALDPDLGAAAALELESGDPLIAELNLGEVLNSLDRFVPIERNSPVEALVSIGAAVRAADNMTDVLSVIADQAKKALSATSISIGRLDHDEQTLDILVTSGSGSERFPVAESLQEGDRPGLGRLLGGQGFVRSIDETRADDPGTISLHRRGLRSEAAWPIIIGDSIWGVAWATSSADASMLDHDDLATLRLVSTHVAAAVVQAERIAEFEELALRDPLTGIGNRRVLDQHLTQIFDRAPIDRQDVALIMCDVDGLKAVNDTNGHAAGDDLLIHAAQSLTAAARALTGSTVCRIGGDEFCVILDGGGTLSAEPVAAGAQKLFGDSGPGRSLSYGIALATPNIATPGALLRAADEAQYEEKRRRKGISRLGDLPSVAARRRSRRGD